MRSFRFFVSAALVLVCAVLASSSRADVALTDAGQPAAVILTAPGVNPSGAIAKAAEEFQLHIQKMSGATLPIDTVGNEGSYPGHNYVYIGASTATAAEGIDVSGLTYEYFVVRTISTHALCIVGRDGGHTNWYELSDCYPGTLFGVYYVLGDMLGCRWVWPGDLGMYVPTNDTVSIPTTDVTDGPLMGQRHYRIPRVGKCYLVASDVYGGSVSIPILPADQPTRDALSLEEQLWLRRQRMGTRDDPPLAHYFTNWWANYSVSHPEYFAVPPPGGPSQPWPAADRVKLDVSRATVWAQRLAETSNSKVNCCPTDSKGHCTCANCMAWDRPSQSADIVWNSSSALLGDRYAHFYNAIAELAPTRTIYGYAYDVYRHPPLETTVRSNVALGYVPGAPSDTDITSIQSTQDDVLGWFDMGCESMYLRPNWFLSAHCGPYWPLDRIGTHFLDLTADGKFKGLDSDSSNSSYACMGPYLYLIARLMADPTLTVAEVRDEYCSAFGPAAPKVLEYLNYWEDFIYDVVDAGNTNIVAWSACVPEYDNVYVASAFDGADAILDQAYALLGPSDTDANARLDFLRLGVTHGRLTSAAIALVHPSETIFQHPEAETAMRELLEFRDANAESWAIWREWFIDREAAYVPNMKNYWSYVLSSSGGGGGSNAGAFIESGGLVVMEAEHYTEKQAGVSPYQNHNWELNTSTAGASGDCMQALPNSALNADTAGTGPRMDFRVDFSTIGTYFIYVRMPGFTSGQDDSCNVGQNGVVTYTNVRNGTGSWSWRKATDAGGTLAMPVTTTGVQTFNIFMREDGNIVDKIVLTTNASYAPAGTDTGPAESPKHADTEYVLTVIDGSGSGDYGAGSVVPITADPAPAGMVFDQWDGDVDYVTDVFAASTTFIMPASHASIQATYKSDQSLYTLTVISGTGDGEYLESTVVPISADTAPAGKVFDKWTGDTASVASVSSADTTVTMPAASVLVTATYKNLPGYHTLTVNTGSGDGAYLTGAVVQIIADTAPVGQSFNKWTGDTAYVTNVNLSTTTVTMPNGDVTVTATYSATYTLVVNNGSGSGQYLPGTEVRVTADTAPPPQVFDGWTGDIEYLDDPDSPSTLLTMPAANVTVSAGYRLGGTCFLTVNSGTGDGTYPEGTVVPINADTPPLGKVFDRWTGDTATVANVSSASTTVTVPGANITVTATYRIPPATQYTLTVNSGSGDGDYSQGAQAPISADAPPSGKVFDQWTGDTAAVANVHSATTTVTMPAANVTVTATYTDAQLYTLTVNSGTGDGDYAEGEQVQIVADAPPGGLVFDRWTGDTAGVTNVRSSTTNVTMPAANVTVTATYTDQIVLFALTVNSGTGDGDYAEAEQVQIVADAAGAGMEFSRWTGDTQYLDDAGASTTTVTMPAADVSVTATYVSSLLRVTYPSAEGIALERGGKGVITWVAPGLDPKAVLRIELSDGVDTWVLTEKAKASKGNLKWSVGKWKSKTGQPVYPNGDVYRIRICTLDESVEDSSDEAFAIGTVTALEIQGPTEVDENSMANYTCMAHFDFGDPQDFTNAKLKWGSSSKAAKVKKGGLLTTKEVLTDDPCTITAGYGKNENFVEGTFDLTIMNR
jgi:hypothetical protein